MSGNRQSWLMPVLGVVILAMLAATAKGAAQKPTIAPPQNHVVLLANNPSALQTALEGSSELKTNMDELALGSRGLSSLGGQIFNPYDLTSNPLDLRCPF